MLHRNKKLYHEFVEDVQTIANFSVDEESWDIVVELFFAKWKDVPKKVKLREEVKAALATLLEYFGENWCDNSDLKLWYQGANPFMNTTNNALESNNRVLKSPGHSNHQMLGLDELFQMVSSVCASYF